jgi:thioredoxin 2
VSSRVQACPSCGRRNRVPASATGKPTCAACKAPLPWLTDADDATFAAVAEHSTLPVLVDLWAPWCGPCRMVSPAVERMASRYAGRLKVTKVNVDLSPGVSARFNAMSIPTLLMIKDGRVVDRIVGAVPEQQLATWVQRWVA